MTGRAVVDWLAASARPVVGVSCDTALAGGRGEVAAGSAWEQAVLGTGHSRVRGFVEAWHAGLTVIGAGAGVAVGGAAQTSTSEVVQVAACPTLKAELGSKRETDPAGRHSWHACSRSVPEVAWFAHQAVGASLLAEEAPTQTGAAVSPHAGTIDQAVAH